MSDTLVAATEDGFAETKFLSETQAFFDCFQSFGRAWVSQRSGGSAHPNFQTPFHWKIVVKTKEYSGRDRVSGSG